MTQEAGQVRAQKGGCGQWFQMHLGKQEDVSKAIGMCLGGMGVGKDTPALRDEEPEEVEEDAPGRVGWEQATSALLAALFEHSNFFSCFWLLQLTLYYFSCDTCLTFQAPNLHHSSHHFFTYTGPVTFSLPRMPEILLHLSHYVSTLYIKV